MRKVNINGHLIDALVLLNSKRLVGGLISSEIGGFIHIQPYPWELYFFI